LLYLKIPFTQFGGRLTPYLERDIKPCFVLGPGLNRKRSLVSDGCCHYSSNMHN
jgi:hypothetical protein